MLVANSRENLLESPSGSGIRAMPPPLAQSPWVYIFGAFRLDPQRGLLVYGAEIVPLPQRLFEILRALVEANGAVVSRKALNSLIWPAGGLPDNNLSQHVYMLRRALGERAGDRLYVATVHNTGFRFIAPVTVERGDEDQSEPLGSQGLDRQLMRPGLEVFRHYSRGCRSLERGSASHLRAAIEQFELSLKIDPDYVPALVALARARLGLSQGCYAAAEQQLPKAKIAAIRALQMEPSSAVAHAVLSNVILFGEWNWRQAKRRFDRAVRLNQESTTVRVSGMWLYEWIGQPERAVIEAQRALMAEPSSAALQLLLGKALICSGDYNGALDHFSNLIDTYPDYAASARCHRAEAFLLSDRAEQAILDLQFLPEDRAEDLALRLPLLALAYADNGQTEKTEHVYDTLVNAARTEYVAQTKLIAPALSAGRPDAALLHLQNAVDRRETALPLVRRCPRLAVLRKSDAYKSLIAAMGS